MSTAPAHDEPAAPADVELPGALRQAFAVLGGQAAWGLALLIAYPMVAIACSSGAHWLVPTVRIVALVVAVAATLVGWRDWRSLRGVTDAGADSPAVPRRVQRVALVSFGGMLLSGIAIFLLVIENLGTLVIHPCL